VAALASMLLASSVIGQEAAGLATNPSGPRETGPPAPAEPKAKGWNDQRRTVHSYLSNLGYDSVRVFAPPNWPRLILGSGLASSASFFDDATVEFFDKHQMTTFGNVGAVAGGAVAVGTLGVGLFAAGRMAPNSTFRNASYDASQAIIIDTVYTLILKSATHRLRPDGSNYQSFPSGHASAAFSWATVFAEHYGAKVGVPAYTIASLIAVSRLAHKSHYLSDIVAGATLGHLVGRTVVHGNSRAAIPASPAEGPKVSVEVKPMFFGHVTGVGVTVVF
jgi:membrane-associated phospholipid phosphatase